MRAAMSLGLRPLLSKARRARLSSSKASSFSKRSRSFSASLVGGSGAGQTLTALGSYWKGRKPLILVRAIVLGYPALRSRCASNDTFCAGNTDSINAGASFNDSGIKGAGGGGFVHGLRQVR